MPSLLQAASLILAAVLGLTIHQLYHLRQNYVAAKLSNLPCVILPVYMFSVPGWLITQPLLTPLLKILPSSWTSQWVPLLGIDRIWHHGYTPFAFIGADTFIAVSPMGNILFTCSPSASKQLLAGNTFEKPARRLLPMLNVFGPTMTGTEGAESRLYRKITAPFFGAGSMQRVWDVSLACVEKLGGHLEDGKLRDALGACNLHVICTVGFGRDMRCINSDEEVEIEGGHMWSFKQTMFKFINHAMAVFLAPHPLLKSSPFQSHREAAQAYAELKEYMLEMKEAKAREPERSQRNQESNILDLLVEAGSPGEKSSHPSISQEAILGNIFIFLFAGHEANVNTLLFTFVLLAAYPRLQARMQADIDRLTSTSWDYATAFGPLMNHSLVGAVLNETLRLYSVIPVLAKTTQDTPQPIRLDGHTHTIAPNTVILINTSAVHRNPAVWRSRPVNIAAGAPSALGDFDPEQWLERDAEGGTRVKTPVEGSYLAFSDGGRGCLGKVFGQAELCAFVARLFKDFTVELKVDDLDVGDEAPLKREKWRKKRKEVERDMSANVEFYMSLRLATQIPVRFVRRGKETFADLEEW